jgi:hypothetical protein
MIKERLVLHIRKLIQIILLFVLLCEPGFFLRVPQIFSFNLSHNPYFLITTITIISTIARIIAILIGLKNKQKNEPLFQNVCLQCNALI